MVSFFDEMIRRRLLRKTYGSAVTVRTTTSTQMIKGFFEHRFSKKPAATAAPITKSGRLYRVTWFVHLIEVLWTMNAAVIARASHINPLSRDRRNITAAPIKLTSIMTACKKL